MDLVVGGKDLTALSAGGLTLGLEVLFVLPVIEQSGSLHGNGVSNGCVNGKASLATRVGAILGKHRERLSLGRKPRH